jgi:RNase H-fold protein (predicted Holliday junction resolvase)
LRSEASPTITIETHDERFTTVIAERGRRAAGTRRGARRQAVDSAAAAVMLQSYLEAHS